MKSTKILGWLVMAAALTFTGCSVNDNTVEGPMEPPQTTQTGNTIDLSMLTGDYVAQNGDVLTGTLSGFYKISIAPGATVTLGGVTIPGRNATDENTPWAGITSLGDATIFLADGTENYVKGYSGDYPAILAGPAGETKDKNTTLTICGKGTLTAESGCYSKAVVYGHAAGIGSGRNQIVGNIWIEGGTIIARGGVSGAGIGCGNASEGTTSCGDITITSGDITATGGDLAAGIGSGNNVRGSNSCDKITIGGGTITATGGYMAAGIGSGNEATCGDINIIGGRITATGGEMAAGIGSGLLASCGDISITGGIFFVMGGSSAAGIGSGLRASCGNITIGGTAIGKAWGNECLNDIGAGYNGTCGTVSIKDGSVNRLYSCTFTVNYYQTDGRLSLVKASKIIVNYYGRDYEFIGDGGGQLGPGTTAMGSLPFGKGLTLTFTAETTAWNSNIPTGTYKATMTDVNITRDSIYLGTVNLVKQ